VIRISRTNQWLLMIGMAMVLTFLAALLIGVDMQSFQTGFSATREIIATFRLPRTTIALTCGGLFGCAGAITQNLFRNPLASPSILGIEASGSLFVTMALLSGLGTIFQPALVTGAALTGCAVAMLAILKLGAGRGKEEAQNNRLILCGLALTTAAGSISSLLLSLSMSEPGKAGPLLHWLLGSLAGKHWTDLAIAAPLGIAGLWLAWTAGPALDVLALGRDVARTCGIRVQTTTRQCVIAVSLMVAASIVAGGLLPFVGLVAPHIARTFSFKSRQLLPASFCTGAILVMVSDVIARTAAGAQELQTGVITGVIGGPFFLWCMWHAGSYGDAQNENSRGGAA
jgi:iron complex transport system permease protein